MTRLTKWIGGTLGLWVVLNVAEQRLPTSAINGWISLAALSVVAVAAFVLADPADGWRRWSAGILISGLATINAIKDLWPLAPAAIDVVIVGVITVLAFASVGRGQSMVAATTTASPSREQERGVAAQEIAA